MKLQFVTRGLAVLALTGAFTISGLAQKQTKQQGGAAGIVAAVLQVATGDLVKNNVVDVNVVRIGKSLNNLTALNNVLNNSPILSKNDVNLTVQDIQALNNNTVLTDFLKNNNIAIGQVVGASVLSGGDIIVFRQ